MNAMLGETRSYHDPSRRLDEAIRAYLERRDRGEEPQLPEWSLHDPEALAALNELLEDERELEPWFGTLRAVTQTESVGRLFGNYELLELEGVGGQGAVYRARQVHINKVVALKLVNPRERRHSLRELEIASNLEHQHLVRVYHVGEHANRLYFTMKLAEKGSLDKHIEEYRLPDARPTAAAEWEAVEERKKTITRLMAKIARAIHYLRGQDVIHCDLKPGNILLDGRGEPFVTDFGFARRIRDAAGGRSVTVPAASEQGEQDATAGGGTAGYMAPEQAQGRTDLNTPVDVYGLGAILYKLLTDRTTFVGTKEEILAKTADMECRVQPPSLYNPNLQTDPDLELICLKCLEKKPGDRYASASDLADDLERYARGQETSVRPRSWPERIARHVVEAINHKLPLFGIARWSAIGFWDAGLNLAVHGAFFALIRTDQPPALLWFALLTFYAVWWWMFLTHLFRRDPVDPMERHLALLWGGVYLAGITLFWIYCPPLGSVRAAGLLAFYPPWAVVNGVAFLVVGRLYWGFYYPVGLAHFLVAALMPLRLDLAPLIYGVFVAVCMSLAAVDHIRTARGENARRKLGGPVHPVPGVDHASETR
jgi:serine/threonine-protein kinase